MSLTEPEQDPAEEENVRYDLAGNPLPGAPPPQAKAYPPPAAMPGPPPAVAPRLLPAAAPGPQPFGSAAWTPPPGSATFASPGAPPPAWGGSVPAARKSHSGPALYAGIGLAFVVLLGLIFGLRAMKPVTVEAPASYKTYTALDSTFSCDQPAGWDVKETGMPGGSMSQVTFKRGDARFHVVSDAAGSLMGDVVGSGNANLPPEQQKPAVEKLHEMDKKQMADSVPDYQEQPAQKFQSAFGDSRFSEWTGDGGKQHGYRATLLGKEREITVICSSPERNWAILQTAFQKMINSLTPGNG